MTESQTSLQNASLKTKKVSIQERSVPVGKMIVVNGYRANLMLLKQRFLAGVDQDCQPGGALFNVHSFGAFHLHTNYIIN